MNTAFDKVRYLLCTHHQHHAWQKSVCTKIRLDMTNAAKIEYCLLDSLFAEWILWKQPACQVRFLTIHFSNEWKQFNINNLRTARQLSHVQYVCMKHWEHIVYIWCWPVLVNDGLQWLHIRPMLYVCLQWVDMWTTSSKKVPTNNAKISSLCVLSIDLPACIVCNQFSKC